MRAPSELGFFQPAEWAPHRGVFLAWPSHADWGADLPEVLREFADLCRHIADPEPQLGTLRGDPLYIVVQDEKDERMAESALGALRPTFLRIPHGDIWLRDTGPIFVCTPGGKLGSVRFVWNGWGNKYLMPGDRELGGRLQEVIPSEAFTRDFVLEGGGVDVDGEGTVLTTKQCLLNPNRNPSLSQEDIERELGLSLGVERVLWLDQGLLNDHTDGHIDTLARFVAPGVVVCMAPSGVDDPNRDTLRSIASDLSRMRDARGRALEVMTMPSPGRVETETGTVMPASYANFYISNSTVVVPTYGTRYDDAALLALEKIFPTRRVVGSESRSILTGGGAFHCITQQIPEARSR